jgi:hypothetical protein
VGVKNQVDGGYRTKVACPLQEDPAFTGHSSTDIAIPSATGKETRNPLEIKN